MCSFSSYNLNIKKLCNESHSFFFVKILKKVMNIIKYTNNLEFKMITIHSKN